MLCLHHAAAADAAATTIVQQASTALKNDGMLVLMGAQAALQPTPTMLGYGMAKVLPHTTALLCCECQMSAGVVVLDSTCVGALRWHTATAAAFGRPTPQPHHMGLELSLLGD